jgi:hypothetical protein
MPSQKESAVKEIHRTNLRFLLALKGAVGILNNLIHDNLALMAIAQFKATHPKLTCVYTNAGAAGIDILGRDAAGNIGLVAEVKTTLPDRHGRIRGPQKSQIKKDLDRLAAYEPDVHRYLVVLSSSTKRAIERQLTTATAYSKVAITNAFEEELVESDEAAAG